MTKLCREVNILIDNLKTILPIANSHMVNFITHNMFENILPEPIQQEILGLSVHELNNIVFDSFSTVKSHNINAPNLTQFLNETHKLSLREIDVCLPLDKFCEYLGSKGYNDSDFGIVKNLMSEKKSHEVEMMSGIVAALARNENCTHLVDIGGGKGYLSSVLAIKHHLKVLSIDSSLTTSKGAAKKIPTVERLWTNLTKQSSKTTATLDPSSPKSSHLCKLATLFIKDDTDIVELIKANYTEDDITRVMLVGLHTCGNLAASSLRLFVNSREEIRCLVNVGCCYHLIVEEFDTTPSWMEVESQASGFGFPMSSFLREKKCTLGRNARMLASQPPDKIRHEGVFETEVLFYRALLERYLETKLCHSNGMPHFRVGKIGRKSSSFIDYVHKSVKRLNLDIQVNDTELQQLYDDHAASRKLLHAFCLLRLAVAPAVEAAIMMDRLLYLEEQGVQDSYLTQLFDPVISPRCFAIVAFNKPQ